MVAEIDEKTDSFSAVLVGFLPDHRRFELKEPSGKMMCGTVTKNACEQFEKAVQSGLAVLGTHCQAEFIVREIRPLNQSTRLIYRLTTFNKLGESS